MPFVRGPGARPLGELLGGEIRPERPAHVLGVDDHERHGPAPPFKLVDERGVPFSLASLRGRPVIVTFIDPLCRDYCPIEAQRLNTVVGSFPQGSKPAIVAVSVNVYGNARANLLQDERKWK